MRFKAFTILLVFPLFFTGCTGHKNDVLQETRLSGHKIPVIFLDLAPKEEKVITLSELCSEYRAIPLETSEECYIGNTMIELSNDNIFVGTQEFPGPARLYLFDMNGKFLNEIGQGGKGPNEHTGYQQDFCHYFDDDNTIVVVWTANKPQLFNPDGKLIQTIQWPYYRMKDIYKGTEGEWFSTGTSAGRPFTARDSMLLVFYTSDGHITKTIPRTIYPVGKRDGYIPSPWGNPVWKFEGKTKIFLPGIDTIYTIENGKLIPAGILLPGNNSLSYNKVQTQAELKGKYRISILDETEHNWYIRKSVIKDVKLMQFSPGQWGGQFDEDVQVIIIDKKTGKAALCKFKDDLYGFIPDEAIPYFFWHKGGNLILPLAAVNMLDMIKEYESKENVPREIAERLKPLKKVHEDDNPVVFLFTLKDRIKIDE